MKLKAETPTCQCYTNKNGYILLQRQPPSSNFISPLIQWFEIPVNQDSKAFGILIYMSIYF